MQTKPSTPTDNAPHPFIQKHQADVIGILHGFDRLRLQGTLRCLYHRNSMEAYLQQARVLGKDFKTFATGLTGRIHESARQIAQAAGRPFCYLASSQVRKEEAAKEIARQDKIETGLDRSPQLRGAVPDLFHARQSPEQTARAQAGAGEVPALLLLSVSSAFRLHVSAAAKLVSFSDSHRNQWPASGWLGRWRAQV
jgi:hypothetical protein